jgi:hypothetical protein
LYFPFLIDFDVHLPVNNPKYLSDPRIGRRNRGRPRRKWDQEFREVVGNQWSRIASDRGKWKDTFLHINKKDKTKSDGK